MSGAVLAIIALGLARSAAGQDITMPADAIGLRARVQFCEARPGVEGTLTGIESGEISLHDAESSLSVPARDIRTLEIRRRDRGRWATIGLFVGAITAFTAAEVIEDIRHPDDYDGFGSLHALFVVAPIGGLIGAPVGAILAPASWQVVPAGFVDVGGSERCR